jgi:hypothetical protein
VADPHGASDTAYETVEVEPPIPWDILILVIVVIGVGAVAMVFRHSQLHPKIPDHGERRSTEPQVQVDVKSGVEYSAGEESNLPDISVDIRSGIWKEREER